MGLYAVRQSTHIHSVLNEQSSAKVRRRRRDAGGM